MLCGAMTGRFLRQRFRQVDAKSAMKFSRSGFPISSRQMCRMIRGAISLVLVWAGLFAATICNGSVASPVWTALLQSPRRSMAPGGRAFVLQNCCDDLVSLNYGPAAHFSAISIATLKFSIGFALLRSGRRSIWRFFQPRARECL